MRVVILITHHHAEERLRFLRTLAGNWEHQNADMVVCSNTDAFSAPPNCRVLPRTGYGHPFNLAWEHKAVLREICHEYDLFVYAEDDLDLSPGHVAYWIESRGTLRPFGMIPGMLRIEKNGTAEYAPDYPRRVNAKQVGTTAFYSTPFPYQACYIMDRELLEEHLASPSSDREGSAALTPWHVRERAAMGNAFDHVPAGFDSRYALPLKDGLVDRRCCVHHMPNTYLNRANNRFGKIPLTELFRK